MSRLRQTKVRLLPRFLPSNVCGGSRMPGTSGHLLQVSLPHTVGIAGRTILVVDDEPLILLDVAQALETAGATVLMASNIDAAMRHAEQASLSGAVLDWVGTGLCPRLSERGLPFLFYSGRPASEFAGWHAPVVEKPAKPEEIIMALERLLYDTSSS